MAPRGKDLQPERRKLSGPLSHISWLALIPTASWNLIGSRPRGTAKLPAVDPSPSDIHKFTHPPTYLGTSRDVRKRKEVSATIAFSNHCFIMDP